MQPSNPTATSGKDPAGKKRFVIELVIFLALFTGILTLYTLFILPKWSSAEEYMQMAGFYEEDEDTIDVLCLGSCNMYTSISPLALYEQYGFTGYDMCTPDQEFHTSYYYLKDALKTQKPKVVVLESLFFTLYNTDHREYYDRFTLDYMPLSTNKLGLINAVSRTESWVMPKYDPSTPGRLLTFAGYLFPALRFHARTDFSQDDIHCFKFFSNMSNWRKGNYVEYIYTPNDENYYSKLFNTHELNDDAKKYFPKIVALCEKNDIPLVVIKSPNHARWDEENTAVVKEFVESYDVPFLDFQSDELNDFEIWDYADRRLNATGSVKLSKTFGQYLVDELGITPTELTDEQRASWDKCLEKYHAVAKKKDMSITAGDLAQVSNSDEGMLVRWNAYDDCDTYEIWRANGSEDTPGAFAKVAEVSGYYYYDASCQPGMGYTYYVVPKHGEHAGEQSNTRFYIRLATPTGFTATATEEGIGLAWNPVGYTSRYRIQRHEYSVMNYWDYDQCDGSSYMDADVSADCRYYYRLQSVVDVDGKTYFSSGALAEASTL